MKKIRGVVVVLVMAGIFLGSGITAYAAPRDSGLDGVVYWNRQDVDDLFSPDLVRSLHLTRDQRNSLDELRRRDWNDRPRDRYSRDLDVLLNLRRSHGGYRIEVGRENNNLQTFLTLLTIGVLISDAQDNDRYYDQGIRIDDFLYLFSRILDLNQRQTFRVYFDRWYDRRYYYNRDRRWDNDRYRWELSREMEYKLRLSQMQREKIKRELRYLYDRQKDRDRHYRDMEKDYLRKNWDRPSVRDFDEYRKRLIRVQRDRMTPQWEARDKFRSVLDDKQRRIFDSMRDRDGRDNWDQNKHDDHKKIWKPKKHDNDNH